MLSGSDIEAYLRLNSISPHAASYIRSVRDEPPSRRVGAGSSQNLHGYFASLKMGCSLTVESYGAEALFALQSEISQDVVEYWDQPQPINILKKDKNGRLRKSSYTPDFLVLEKRSAYLVEVKTRASFDRLSSERSEDWHFLDEAPVYWPAYEAFEKLGLQHKVFIVEPSDNIRRANLSILYEILHSGEHPSSNYRRKALNCLNEHMALSLEKLRLCIGDSSYSDILYLILQGEIHADLSRTLLSKAESTYVSLNPELLKEHYQLLDEENRFQADPIRRPVSTSEVPTLAEAEVALARLKRVESNEKGRSIRRWRKAIEDGRREGKTSFQSLLPNRRSQGNRKPRINRTVEEHLADFLAGSSLDVWPNTKIAIYRQYRLSAEEAHIGLEPVSYDTFLNRIKNLDQVKLKRRQGGRRLANKERPPSRVADRSIKAELPFESAQIDHALSKIYVVIADAAGKRFVCKPWVTAMIDQGTKVVLGRYVSLRPPSSLSCAMVIRDCVRRFRKLPSTIVVDQGSDFRSIYFSSLLANYGINHFLRPAANPRFGSEIERLNWEVAQGLWASSKGNEVVRFASRSISEKHSPKSSAALSPSDFIEKIDLYFELRSEKLSDMDSLSMRAAFEAKRERYPFVGRSVSYDDAFQITTAVDVSQYRLDPARGIKFNGRFYSHPRLFDPGIKNKELTVRKEPENPFVAYVFLRGEWYTAEATGSIQFSMLAAKERSSATLADEGIAMWGKRIKEEIQMHMARNQMTMVRTGPGISKVKVHDDQEFTSDKFVEDMFESLMK